jgi:hypothetical protein
VKSKGFPMISSLEVGSEYRIVDLASRALQTIAGEMKELGIQADRVREVLGSISNTAFAAFRRGSEP